jgi:hypothetical protein
MKISENDYIMACVKCRRKDDLQLFPHRIGDLVLGVLVACSTCAKEIRGGFAGIKIEKKEGGKCDL